MVALKRRCAICHTSYSQGESFCPRDGGAVVAEEGPAADDLVGSTIDGRYLVTRLLGRGGMGKVYEADHVGLGKRVAIKFVSDSDANREQRARFRQEARAASKVAHENVIQIFDVGADGGRDYLVMEYVEGRDLEAVLHDGVLPPARAIAIAQQILRGLHACHEAGIVHRDIKPSNIRLTSDQDFVKIMDFGISKSILPNVAQTDTGTGRVIGTPEFMAPEQLVDGEVDRRADIFAVGATLYAMLAGASPFAGTSFTRRIEERDTHPRPLDELRGGLPASLVAAISRALAASPADRFPDALAFADALQDGAAIAGARAEAPTKRASLAALAPTEAATGSTKPSRPRNADHGDDAADRPAPDAARERPATRRRGWLLPLAFLAVAAVSVAATAWIVTREREPGANTVAHQPVAAPVDAALVAPEDAAVVAPVDAAVVAPVDAAPTARIEPRPNIAPVKRDPPRPTELPAGTVIAVEDKGQPCLCEFTNAKGSIDYACSRLRKEPSCTCQKDSTHVLCPVPYTVVDQRRILPDGSRSGTMYCIDRTRAECDPLTKLPGSCNLKYSVAVDEAPCSGYLTGMPGTASKLAGKYRCTLCDSTPGTPRFYGKTGDTCVGLSRVTGEKVTGKLRC